MFCTVEQSTLLCAMFHYWFPAMAMQHEHICKGINESSLVHELRVVRSTPAVCEYALHPCTLNRMCACNTEQVAVHFKGNFRGL